MSEAFIKGMFPKVDASMIRGDKMKLRAIERHEDKRDEAYNSNECRLLLEAYEDLYPKIGKGEGIC